MLTAINTAFHFTSCEVLSPVSHLNSGDRCSNRAHVAKNRRTKMNDFIRLNACYSFCVKASPLHHAWIVVVLVLLASAAACRSKDPVALLMEELEQATEARDVSAFEKRLASSFAGNDRISRDEARATLRRYFAAYERISLDISNMERSESGNRVKFQVSFSGQVNAAFNLQNLLPSTATYDFELRFAQEAGTLKVQKAFWQEVSGL